MTATDEPCVCSTDFTCMADVHDSAAGTVRALSVAVSDSDSTERVRVIPERQRGAEGDD